MSLKKIEQVKKDKGFKVLDLIVYGVLAAAVVALFIGIFLLRDNRNLSGIRVTANGVPVFEYSFDGDEYSVLKDGFIADLSDSEVKLTVTVKSDYGYNKIEINKTGRSVQITDADCLGGDCVVTPPIKDNGGIIYCSPHRLKIEPLNIEKDDGIIPVG